MTHHPDLADLVSPIPDWLHAAFEIERRQASVTVAGCPINYFSWGDAGARTLLFVHGRMSHARCWAFVAPLLAHRFHCVAIDLSGMGDSGRREHYAYDNRASELVCIVENQSHTAMPKPLIVSHSYGAIVAIHAMQQRPDLFGGLIACDPSLSHPDEWPALAARTDGPELSRPGRVYPDLATPVGRFRFAPPQTCDHPELKEYIARHSVKKVTGGWTWKFDPYVYSSHEEGHNDWWVKHSQNFVDLDKPKALIYGRESSFMSTHIATGIAQACNAPLPITGIAHAHHHLMADQPIALAAAIEAMESAIR